MNGKRRVSIASLRTICHLRQPPKNPAYLMTLRRCRATDCKFQLPDHEETGRIRSNRTMSKAARTRARHWATDCIPQVSRRRETGRIRAQSGFNLFEEGLSGEHPDSHNVVVEQTVVDPKERPSSDVRVSSEEKSTDLPFTAERSKRPNTSKPIGRHIFFIFPTIRIAKFAISHKLPGLRAGKQVMDTAETRRFFEALRENQNSN